MIRYVLILLVTMLMSTSGWAQKRDSLRFRQSSVAVVPQYLIQQAIRIDLEKPLIRGKQIHRLTLSPYLYSGTTRRYRYEGIPLGVQQPDDYGDTRVKGFGLEVLDKYTLRFSSHQPSNFYLAYGVGYHRLRLDYIAYEPVPFIEEGVQLFRFGFTDQRERIHRLDVVGLIGLKGFLYRNILFFDLFTGPVLKNSWMSTRSGVVREHDETIDHGFEGVTYRVGAAIGVMIF